MPVRLFRRLVSALVIAAYLSVTMLGVAPPCAAAGAGDMSGMTMKADGGMNETMPMPCEKHMKPGCVTELGCIFMVSLPAPDLSVSTIFTWSRATYPVSSEFLTGRSPPPLLGPPRSRA